jgi:hypothetical protein
MNFLTKELVDSFVYSNIGSDREDSKSVVIKGRTYIKLGTVTATTIVANVYKVYDSSVKPNKYVALFGVARQHPCDVKVSREQGTEVAATNAQSHPIMQIEFDHQPNYFDLKPFMEAYINSLEVVFVKTKQELIAEGKEKELKAGKYNR